MCSLDVGSSNFGTMVFMNAQPVIRQDGGAHQRGRHQTVRRNSWHYVRLEGAGINLTLRAA
jgi:hypothetical protein